MPARAPASLTYDGLVLHALALEFFASQYPASEHTIRGRLKRKKLGPYDAARVARLRALKDRLQEEISRGARSAYFISSHGRYGEMTDFDVARLTRDTVASFPDVDAAEIASFVPFCVFNYYLR